MGPHLVKDLQKAGHSITCINRRGLSQLTTAIACDRRDSNHLRTTIEGLDPDVVVDMIPFTRSDAESLAEILRGNSKVQLIAVSSIDVYPAYGRLHRTEVGAYQECPLRECDALREKISFQGESYDKLAVEEVYLGEHENVSILRMPAIYGWPDRSRIQEYVTAAISEKGELRINPRFAQWGFSRASAQDCAYAVSLTIGLKGQRIFNVAEPELLTEEQWCKTVWQAMEFEGNLILDEDCPIPFNADILQGWHVDTSKIRSELGYEERTNQIEVLRHNIENLLAAEPN